MKRIIGIDPGLTGGLGVLDLDAEGRIQCARLARTPVVRVRRGHRERIEYDVAAMCDLLQSTIGAVRDFAVIVLEEQQAMPTALRGRLQGGRSTFRTGLSYGLWTALAVASGVAYRTVRPAIWKRHFGLLGQAKSASRLRCAQRVPRLAPIAAKDEGPAEGLLLALYVADMTATAREPHTAKEARWASRPLPNPTANGSS